MYSETASLKETKYDKQTLSPGSQTLKVGTEESAKQIETTGGTRGKTGVPRTTETKAGNIHERHRQYFNGEQEY